MPRQIDLNPGNLKVTYDPNSQLGVTQGQLNQLQSQIPAALEKAQIAFINAVLQGIDDVTGWNLLEFAQQAEAGLTYTGNLATDLWNYIFGAGTNASNAWDNWVTTLENLEQTSIAEFTAYLQNISQAWQQIENLLQTGDWNDLPTAWNSLVQALFGTSTTAPIFGQIPSTSVAKVTQSLQPVADFPNPQSLQAAGQWSWDGTVDHTGKPGSGSARCVANGQLNQLGGVPCPVQAGQVINVQAFVQWSGLTAVNTPIQLQIIPWSGTTTPGTPQTPVVPSGCSITNPGVSSSGWVALAGTYTVPANVSFVQLNPVVTGDASVGTVWWDDITDTVTGGYLDVIENDLSTLQNDEAKKSAAFVTLLQSGWAALQNDSGNWPQLITDLESVWQTYWSTVSAANADEVFTLQQLFNSILGIDPNSGMISGSNVQGMGGLQDLVTTWDAWVNQLGAALGGDVADAGGLTWLAQLMNDLGVKTTHVQTVTQSNADILATVNNCPVAAGLETTVTANGDYHQATPLTGATVTKTTSRGALITIGQAKELGFSQWLGSYSTTPSGFVINFYKMDSSGNLNYLFTTTDLSATVASTLQWYVEDVTGIPVNIGDVIGVELQIKTSGSLTPYGFTQPAAGNHPTALIKQLGFTQNWNGSTASTITATNIGWAPTAPYIGLGVGTPPPTPNFPQTSTFTTNSTYTMQSWSNFIDLIAVGDGGGGEGELGFATGYGGTGGSWATQTLTVGTDINAGTVFTITVGQGGTGGPYFTAGGDGHGTTITWTDIHGATQTLTAAGGRGGNHTLGFSYNTLGQGLAPNPQNKTYQGATYFGGGPQFLNVPGVHPGGGGQGAQPFQYGTQGAPGQAWIVDRQT